MIENLPFDKYEMEASPLTQYILSRKKPSSCWPVCDVVVIDACDDVVSLSLR